MDIISELMNTLLPCLSSRPISSAALARAPSRESAVQIPPHRQRQLLRRFMNSGASIISRSAMVCACPFGLSMPIVDLPGMRSIKWIRLAARDTNLRSARLIRLYLMPASGLEFEGRNHRPGIDLCHASLNIEFKALASIARARCFSSSSSSFWPTLASRSREGEGNL